MDHGKIDCAMKAYLRFYEMRRESGMEPQAALLTAYSDMIICFTFSDQERELVTASVSQVKAALSDALRVTQ